MMMIMPWELVEEAKERFEMLLLASSKGVTGSFFFIIDPVLLQKEA